MIVLYNTQEFVPAKFAPFPGELTAQRGRSVGRRLAGRDPGARRTRSFTWPNTITQGGLRRLGRAARLEVLQHVGRRLHADDRDATTRARRRSSGGWLTARYGKGTSPTSPMRSPPVAVRRARRLPPAGEPAGAREDHARRSGAIGQVAINPQTYAVPKCDRHEARRLFVKGMYMGLVSNKVVANL